MMWIRSQDKTILLKANYVRVNENQFGFCSIEAIHSDNLCTLIGTYSTKEKALSVLNKIENFIYAKDFFEKGFGSNLVMNNVFHMPKDSEVEDDENSSL